jgi:hypothetical protein
LAKSSKNSIGIFLKKELETKDLKNNWKK